MKRCIFTVELVVNENVKIDGGIQSNENANSLVEFSHIKYYHCHNCQIDATNDVDWNQSMLNHLNGLVTWCNKRFRHHVTNVTDVTTVTSMLLRVLHNVALETQPFNIR